MYLGPLEADEKAGHLGLWMHEWSSRALNTGFKLGGFLSAATSLFSPLP